MRDRERERDERDKKMILKTEIISTFQYKRIWKLFRQSRCKRRSNKQTFY